MAIDVFDAAIDEPKPLKSTGKPGELVCTQPFPSQPLQFFGDGGQEKYQSSYFGRFGRNVWCQGDFIMKCPDTGGLVIIGRSDGVLSPSGVRFGSAEIYAVTETFTTEIVEALCIGQRRRDDEDESVLLVVKLRPGIDGLTADLVNRIKSAIREKYSPRHVPAYVFDVADIPYTPNGKKGETNVKHIVSGVKTEISGTVANPESFELYKKYFNLPRITSIGQRQKQSSKL
jgi:acetoacetyl-CoA synthetase